MCRFVRILCRMAIDMKLATTTGDFDKFKLTYAEKIRSIEVCGILGIPNTVAHSGWASGIGKEEYFLHLINIGFLTARSLKMKHGS